MDRYYKAEDKKKKQTKKTNINVIMYPVNLLLTVE